MNAFAIVILAALLGAFAIDLIARLLDVRALGGELPPEFRGLYDPEPTPARRSTRAPGHVFALLESTVWLAALLAFWFSGGFRWADHLVRGLGLSPVPTGLLFIGLLALGSAALGLPFRAYSTFVVEEQFGFNRTTPRTFLLDLAKSAALSIAFGAPILGLILLFFERAGSNAWIYCWIAAAVFTLLAQVIYPTWILPWFNKLEPLAEGELRTAILRYAERVGFPLAGVYVIDGSRRSTRANAFFAGLGGAAGSRCSTPWWSAIRSPSWWRCWRTRSVTTSAGTSPRCWPSPCSTSACSSICCRWCRPRRRCIGRSTSSSPRSRPA